MLAAVRCPACDHENPDTARFCVECAAPLARRCAACGTAAPAGAKFCPECAAPLTGAAAPLPPAPEPAGGERRQLTILFCDLVGSTQLAAGLDPEDWRELVRGYQAAADAVVARFGGHVAQHLGDGLLVYFGWPEAHDDDAERAVRAALALVEAMAARDARLQLRVGLHTGPVVVSDVGGGGRVETLALGDAPNLAARVQAEAAAGEVFATAATHRLVSGLFLVEARGTRALKGVRDPVELFRVVRPSGVRGKLAAAAVHGLSPFVGREDERRLLRSRFEQASEGEGQVVLLVGEPGIGKSRLAQRLREDLAGTPHSWLETGGAPYFASTPFYAVSELLKQFFSWSPDDGLVQRVAGLARALEVAGLWRADALPLIAPLLDLPLPKGYSPVLAAPEVARKRLLATLAEWVFAIARTQPLVILLEDVHWVDPSTLALQQILVDQGSAVPLLLLYTARPELRVPWPMRAHHTQLTLNRLAKKHTRALIEQVAARAVLPAEVMDAVVARTDGVPLFVEELTKAAVESGAKGAQEIPPTLADSLMARLDRLGPAAREVAQVASVLGREFTYALLHAVHPIAEAELEAALAKLGDAELVYAHGIPPEASYSFKHALVQDAAYGSLLKSRRRELHGRAAKVLGEQLRDVAEAHPELLAHHHTGAGAADPAADAWQRAGERALERGAHGEAAQHLERGLALLAALPESDTRDGRELRMQITLGQALQTTKGYASPEVAVAYARARELGERVARPAQLVALLVGLWTSAFTREGPLVAQPLADQALAASERRGAERARVWPHIIQGHNRYHLGDLAGAREHLSRALALCDEAAPAPVPVDPRIPALSRGAWTAWQLGYADQARAQARKATELAHACKRPADRAWAESDAARLYAFLREPAEALRHADAALAACAEEPNPFYEGSGRAVRRWALASLGQVEGDSTTAPAGPVVRLSAELGAGLRAEEHARAGDLVAALRVLAESEGAVPGEEVWRADTLRRRAELLAQTGASASEVETLYNDSLAWARRQGALAYELRTATNYARFLCAHARASEARDLLAPVYARFTEGFDTRDLVEAKALLGELDLT